MKKALAAVLAASLLTSLSAPAFAATNDGGDTSIPVDGVYQATPTPDVISVDIAWDSMNFTYTGPSNGTWNPETHEYKGVEWYGHWSWDGATEEKTAPDITVTNHSNTKVRANFTFKSETEWMDGDFSKGGFFLETAEGTEYADAPSETTTFQLDGDEIDKDQALGNIVISVSKADAVSTISTQEELLASQTSVGYFKLANDIELEGYKSFEVKSEYYVLDLDGHTLSGDRSVQALVSAREGTTVIKNGTIHNKSAYDGMAVWSWGTDTVGADVVLENCTLISDSCALESGFGTVSAKNCSFKNAEYSYTILISAECELSLSGDVRINGGSISNQNGGVTKLLAGTYDFDPTAYTNTEKFTVTKNEETGIWTVAEK